MGLAPRSFGGRPETRAGHRRGGRSTGRATARLISDPRQSDLPGGSAPGVSSHLQSPAFGCWEMVVRGGRAILGRYQARTQPGFVPLGAASACAESRPVPPLPWPTRLARQPVTPLTGCGAGTYSSRTRCQGWQLRKGPRGQATAWLPREPSVHAPIRERPAHGSSPPAPDCQDAHDGGRSGYHQEYRARQPGRTAISAPVAQRNAKQKEAPHRQRHRARKDRCPLGRHVSRAGTLVAAAARRRSMRAVRPRRS